MPFAVVGAVAAGIGAVNTVASWLCCGPSAPSGSGGSRGSSSGSGSSGSSQQSTSPMSGLTASFAPKASPIAIADQPTFTDVASPLEVVQQGNIAAPAPVNAKRGGPIGHYDVGGGVPEVSTRPTFVQSHPQLTSGFNKNISHPQVGSVVFGHKDGGEIQEHRPEFFSEGGLNHTFVQGAGDGTSDSVPAMLANGEFVIPADVVSSLGNGDNKSGAKVMDEFLKTIRSHNRDSAPGNLPPDSKGPLGYLLEAKKKVK